MKLVKKAMSLDQQTKSYCENFEVPYQSKALNGYKISKAGGGLLAVGLPLEFGAAALGFSKSAEHLQYLVGKSVLVTMLGGMTIGLAGVYKMASAEIDNSRFKALSK